MFDAENMFSKGQAVTGTALSSDTVDVGPGDVGPGAPIILEVVAPPASGATLTVEVQTDDTDAFASPKTIDTHIIPVEFLERGGSILAAALGTGYRRYIRLNYVGTGLPAGFAVTSGLVFAGQTNH